MNHFDTFILQDWNSKWIGNGKIESMMLTIFLKVVFYACCCACALLVYEKWCLITAPVWVRWLIGQLWFGPITILFVSCGSRILKQLSSPIRMLVFLVAHQVIILHEDVVALIHLRLDMISALLCKIVEKWCFFTAPVWVSWLIGLPLTNFKNCQNKFLDRWWC